MPDPSTTAKALLIALALCAGSTQSPAVAYTTQPTSFDQIDLPVETITGLLTLQAESGWVWKNGNTHRIVLDRDVQVTIGGSTLNARRANIWLAPKGPPQNNTYQLFAIFENLTSTDGSFSGKQVPVRAIIKLDQPIKLTLGARIDERPSRKDMIEFMDRSQTLYNHRLTPTPQSKSASSTEPASNLRWAPKELPSSTTTADPQRTLPMPTVARGVSRVEQVLAATRGRDLIAELKKEHQQRTAKKTKLFQKTPSETPSPTAKKPETIFKATGIFSIAIDGKVILQGVQPATQNDPARPPTITATGGITMQYQDPATRQTMDLKAQRAVIFLNQNSNASTAPSQLNASQIQGIYLEGGVFAGNADWSVRSPKIYIDLVNDKMLMLDAVFWTVDQKTNMPLYLRADSVRQTSQGEFVAKKARISNSAFYQPDLSIGLSTLKVSIRDEKQKKPGLLGLVGSITNTLSSTDDLTDDPLSTYQISSPIQPTTIEPGSDLVRRVFIEGDNITLRLGSIPIFWVPKVKGTVDAFPLKEVQIGDTNRTGLSIRTRWDAFSLFGIDPIPNVKARFQLDYYGERGYAFGLSGGWNTPSHQGNLYSYLLPNDNGTDVTTPGRDIQRSGEVRGRISFDDIWTLDDSWTLITKANYISDEAFIPAFERRTGREEVDFDSLLRLERTSQTTQFAIEFSGSPNDFFAAEQLLQSPGYAVDKYPEASFISVANDLFPDTLPGVFQYQYEASIGAMRLRFSEVTAAEYGFDLPSLSNAAFGTAPGVSLADTQRALGLNEDTVARFDTRHEITARFDAGPIAINPFVVGRITAYDTSFDTFSPSQTDDIRYWGAAGMTLSTTLTKVNDNARSDFFDIHRIRHIVEPSVTFWQADSGFAIGDTPIFDDDVEALIRGTMIRAAIDQTWTTKRGGAGRWRDADILKINTEYVWSSDRAGTSIIPDYYLARPELSNPGTYLGSDIIFSPTDVLAFSGSLVFDIDQDRAARTSTGILVEHRPGMTSSLEYRDIRALDATFLTARTRYILTEKYTIATSANYNFDQGDFQNFFARIERQFQVGTLGISVNYNNIRAETSIGIVFRPFGTSGAGVGAGGDLFRE